MCRFAPYLFIADDRHTPLPAILSSPNITFGGCGSIAAASKIKIPNSTPSQP
jgi:hypothetical protein